jgi:hypothetical protein
MKILFSNNNFIFRFCSNPKTFTAQKAGIIISIMIILFSADVFLSCGTLIDTIIPFLPDENDGNGDIFYSTSFETSLDTLGWQQYGYVAFRNEGAPGCGEKCIYVTGGCFAPHFFKVFDSLKEDGYFKVRFWGKNLAVGGNVILDYYDGRQQAIYTAVKDTVWTFYESENTLHVPPGYKFQVELNAGGKMFSEMLIDKLQIIKVF